MTYELVLLPVAVIVVVLIVSLDVLVREAPRLFNVRVAPHAFVVTIRVSNMTSKRRIVLLYPCNSVKRLFATWAEKVEFFILLLFILLFALLLVQLE